MGEKGAIFHFSIIKRFDERDIINIEIHFKNDNDCDPSLELFSYLIEDDDDDYKEYRLYPDSLPNFKSGQCFYIYSIRLSDDISRIGFEVTLIYNSDNILYAKIYEKTESSILWIILLCICLGIVLIGVGIGLFCYFYKKRENKSVINEALSPEIEPVFKPSIENSQN